MLRSKIFFLISVELNRLGPPIREWHKWFKFWADKIIVEFRNSWRFPHNEIEVAIKQLLNSKGDELTEEEFKNISETFCVSTIIDEDNEEEDDDEGDDRENDDNGDDRVASEPLLEPDEYEDDIFNYSPEVDEEDTHFSPTAVASICQESKEIEDYTFQVKSEPVSPRSEQPVDQYEHELIFSISEINEQENVQIKSEPLSPSIENQKLDSLENSVDEFIKINNELKFWRDNYFHFINEQFSNENEFLNKMTNFLMDVKKNLQNIEEFLKSNLLKNEKIIEIKKEKLKAYLLMVKNESDERQEDLQMQINYLANKQREFNRLSMKK